jgi:hypothetical protein
VCLVSLSVSPPRARTEQKKKLAVNSPLLSTKFVPACFYETVHLHIHLRGPKGRWNCSFLFFFSRSFGVHTAEMPALDKGVDSSPVFADVLMSKPLFLAFVSMHALFWIYNVGGGGGAAVAVAPFMRSFSQHRPSDLPKRF